MNVSCPECRSIFRVDPAKVPSAIVRARCSVCGGVITISAGSAIEDEFSSNSAATSHSNRSSELTDAMAAQRANAALAAAMLDTSAPPRVPKGPTPANAIPAAVPDLRAQMVEAAPVAKIVTAPAPQQPASVPAPGGQNAAGRPMLFPPRPMMPGNAPSAGAASRPIVAPRPSVPSAPAAVPPSSAPPPRTSVPNLSAPPANTQPAPGPLPSRPATGNASTGSASSAGAPTAARTPINPFLANDPHAKAKRLARALVSDLVTYFPQKRQDGLRDGTLKQLFKDEIQKSYEEYVLQVGREFAESTPHFQEALNDLLAGGQKVF